MPRNSGTAFGESSGRKPVGWNETDVGAAGDDAPVERRGGMLSTMPNDLICRTAGYVTRMSGGVGGGGREAFPYPDSASSAMARYNSAHSLPEINHEFQHRMRGRD